MTRIYVLILAFCTLLMPATAQVLCSDQACPNGGPQAVGVWPYCGCPRPDNCPVRTHTYTCHGYVYEGWGEQGVVCSCDWAPPKRVKHYKDFCMRMLTVDNQHCKEDPNSPGACLCP